MGPEVVHLIHGSPAWLSYKRSYRAASESAAVMGEDPFCTAFQVWLVKTARQESLGPTVGDGDNVGTAGNAIGRGLEAFSGSHSDLVTCRDSRNREVLIPNAMERNARLAYEVCTGHVVERAVLRRGNYLAGLDGITMHGDHIVAIKFSSGANGVARHWAIEVQHQLMVAGIGVAHLWAYDGREGHLHVIERDPKMMAAICSAWDEFWRYVESDSPPPQQRPPEQPPSAPPLLSHRAPERPP